MTPQQELAQLIEEMIKTQIHWQESWMNVATSHAHTATPYYYNVGQASVSPALIGSSGTITAASITTTPITAGVSATYTIPVGTTSVSIAGIGGGGSGGIIAGAAGGGAGGYGTISVTGYLNMNLTGSFRLVIEDRELMTGKSLSLFEELNKSIPACLAKYITNVQMDQFAFLPTSPYKQHSAHVTVRFSDLENDIKYLKNYARDEFEKLFTEELEEKLSE